MGVIVQKYGGTSVGSIERLQCVADRVARSQRQGHQLIIVVSAMSGETNRLLDLGKQMTDQPIPRELDALASTGEQITSALLAIRLNAIGIKARSFLGHQLRILTDNTFTKARIRSIDASQVQRALSAGYVAVAAGFQGVDDDGNITTLGRGGSDTSAVAIAAAVNADVCEIYTDVDGVYTTDPNVCPSARKIERIAFEEMLELASLGAKVLQIRSVEVAMKYNVPVHVRSSFSEGEGTWVVADDGSFESNAVTGVASDKNEVKLTIRSVPDTPGIVARVFKPLAEAKITVDMIIQNISHDGTTDLTFTVTKTDAAQARAIAEDVSKDIGAHGVVVDDDVAKVSIVGMGMRSHAGVASKMFELLAKEGINIIAISTSEIKVSCLLQARYTELAVRVLHDGFGLGVARAG